MSSFHNPHNPFPYNQDPNVPTNDDLDTKFFPSNKDRRRAQDQAVGACKQALDILSGRHHPDPSKKHAESFLRELRSVLSLKQDSFLEVVRSHSFSYYNTRPLSFNSKFEMGCLQLLTHCGAVALQAYFLKVGWERLLDDLSTGDYFGAITSVVVSIGIQVVLLIPHMAPSPTTSELRHSKHPDGLTEAMIDEADMTVSNWLDEVKKRLTEIPDSTLQSIRRICDEFTGDLKMHDTLLRSYDDDPSLLLRAPESDDGEDDRSELLRASRY